MRTRQPTRQSAGLIGADSAEPGSFLLLASCDVCQFCDGGIEALNGLLAITRCHRRNNCCSLSKTKQFSTSQEKFNRIFYSHHRENFKIYLPWGCWRMYVLWAESVLVNFNKALIKSSKLRSERKIAREAIEASRRARQQGNAVIIIYGSSQDGV